MCILAGCLAGSRQKQDVIRRFFVPVFTLSAKNSSVPKLISGLLESMPVVLVFEGRGNIFVLAL